MEIHSHRKKFRQINFVFIFSLVNCFHGIFDKKE